MTVEDIKRDSGFLRGGIPEELGDGTDSFEPRQTRCCSSSTGSTSRTTATSGASGRSRSSASTTRAWCGRRSPAAGSRAEQWLALDRLADLADGTMRLTTRQGVQFHVVHKGELHELVARHQPRPADDARRVRRRRAQHHGLAVARRAPGGRSSRSSPTIVARFRPQTESYWELWVDGEKACTAAPAPLPLRGPKGRKRSAEPIYGDVYLPRKFKIMRGLAGRQQRRRARQRRRHRADPERRARPATSPATTSTSAGAWA